MALHFLELRNLSRSASSLNTFCLGKSRLQLYIRAAVLADRWSIYSFMGIFNRRNDLRLGSRTDTTISVTVPPKTHDFSSLIPTAHTRNVQELLEDLGTSPNDGLSKNEAVRRLASCGENLLQGKDGVSPWRVLFGQLCKYLETKSPLSRRSRGFSKCLDYGTACRSSFKFWSSRLHRRSSHRCSHCS